MDVVTQSGTKRKIYGSIMIVLILIFLIALAIYAIKGTYSRYAQDDYCYGYRVHWYGFFEMQTSSYFGPTEFNSNRYSLTLSHTVVELLGGPYVFPILPLLMIISWAFSCAYVVYAMINRRIDFQAILLILTPALGILFFTLYLANNLYQILYWLSAQQTYLMPMVLYTFIVARLIRLARRAVVKKRNILELALLSTWAGGFSETTTLWFLAFLCIVFLMAIYLRNKLDGFKIIRKVFLSAIISTVVALVILMICPANIYRAMGNSFVQPDFITFIQGIFVYGIKFILISLKDTPLPFLVIAILGFWLAFIASPKNLLSPRRYLLAMGIATISMYLLSVAVMVPTMYSMSSYPGDRAQLPAHFSLIIYIFSMGWFASLWVQSQWANLASKKLVAVGILLIGLLLVIYSARTIPNVLEKIDLYKARAEAWDQRNAFILIDRANGIMEINTSAFESVYGITELNPNPKHWVNGCAAKYYGVNSITAIENYNGIGIVPIGK